MTVQIKHRFASNIANGANANLVRPSDWNEDHDLIVASNRLIGRSAVGIGPAHEILIGDGLELNGSSLRLAVSAFTSSVYVSPTPPPNPTLNALWLQI